VLDEPTNGPDVGAPRARGTGFARLRRLRRHHEPRPPLSDRIGGHMPAFEGVSHVEWFEGNFADCEEDKRRRLGADSGIPHRLKHNKVLLIGSDNARSLDRA
jgi:hypothetical protein